jgi:hypothetical protein
LNLAHSRLAPIVIGAAEFADAGDARLNVVAGLQPKSLDQGRE